jgi:acyl-CoA thioester hydrolase
VRFEIPEAKKLTLEIVIPSAARDMDAMGHVSNTIYLRYFEIVGIEWLCAALVVGVADPDGEAPVIVNTFCNFLRQPSTRATCWRSTTSRSRGETASRRT